MQEIFWLIVVVLTLYLLLAAVLYRFQRKLIYFPMAPDPEFDATPASFDNNGMQLRGWVLNPDRPAAMLYFGGNSELISQRREFFEDVFRDYSVYLVDYRGFGNSDGAPSEAALFSDALAIYDRLAARHQTITAYGRSLGSGVAVYLARHRPLRQLILLTPYDSVVAVAKKIYPLFPVGLLLKDRFDSASLAPQIKIPVFIASAEFDREIKLSHTLVLVQAFAHAPLEYRMIAGAAHNDIVEFPEYRRALRQFVEG